MIHLQRHVGALLALIAINTAGFFISLNVLFESFYNAVIINQSPRNFPIDSIGFFYTHLCVWVVVLFFIVAVMRSYLYRGWEKYLRFYLLTSITWVAFWFVQYTESDILNTPLTLPLSLFIVGVMNWLTIRPLLLKPRNRAALYWIGAFGVAGGILDGIFLTGTLQILGDCFNGLLAALFCVSVVYGTIIGASTYWAIYISSIDIV